MEAAARAARADPEMANTRLLDACVASPHGEPPGSLSPSVQAALIDLREAEEFDTELPSLTPTDRGGFDRNGRTQTSIVCRSGRTGL